MTPDQAPADIVDQAAAAWRTAPQERNGEPTRMRHALAAAWPAIASTTRAQVAAELRNLADRYRTAARTAPNLGQQWHGTERARDLDELADQIERKETTTP